MTKVVRQGQLGEIAHCRVCNWKDESVDLATSRARYHCKKTGHIVDIERTFWLIIKNNTNEK